MARGQIALLISALTLTAAAAAAAAELPPPPYVVLGGDGPVARAIMIPDANRNIPQCPRIEVDGTPKEMTVRAEPDGGNFNVRVCEFPLGSAEKAMINELKLPLPPSKLNSIAVFGDTGCRLKADKSAALAARDPDEADEVEEGGKYQDCNDPVDWPFAFMSAKIAKAKPDLVVHVGDYYYRESPCPPGNSGCDGSPHGDNWDSWAADFFTPAAPLLKAAPWIVVRGNHENCERGGPGYARLLDPRLAKDMPTECEKIISQYWVKVGGRTFIVLDSSNAEDECPCNSGPYAEQFERIAKMHPPAGTWLVTHKPIWGFTNKKGKLGIRNFTLQAALKPSNAPPKGIDLVLSGHIHLWESLSFADKRSPQFVLGNGSTELAKKITEDLEGQPIGGTTVAAAATEHRFGYTLFEPSKKGKHWNATFYDACGEAKLACEVEPSKVTCKKPKKA
jgi:hypothetical protein